MLSGDVYLPNYDILTAQLLCFAYMEQEIKAFYMRQNDDGKTVAAMDVLVPRVWYPPVLILWKKSSLHHISYFAQAYVSLFFILGL